MVKEMAEELENMMGDKIESIKVKCYLNFLIFILYNERDRWGAEAAPPIFKYFKECTVQHCLVGWINKSHERDGTLKASSNLIDCNGGGRLCRIAAAAAAVDDLM